MATVKFVNVLFSKVLVNRVAEVCALRPSNKDDDADDITQMRSAQLPQHHLLGDFFTQTLSMHTVIIMRWYL